MKQLHQYEEVPFISFTSTSGSQKDIHQVTMTPSGTRRPDRRSEEPSLRSGNISMNSPALPLRHARAVPTPGPERRLSLRFSHFHTQLYRLLARDGATDTRKIGINVWKLSQTNMGGSRVRASDGGRETRLRRRGETQSPTVCSSGINLLKDF